MITWHYIHHTHWTVSLNTTADTGAFPYRMAASTTNFSPFSLPDALAFVNRRAWEVATSSFWAYLAPSLNISSWVWRLFTNTSFNQYIIQHMHSMIHHLWYTSTLACFSTEMPHEGSLYYKVAWANRPI